MPPLKGILADRNDSNQSCLCIFNKASLLNIHRKDWNFMGKLINLF